MASAIPHVTAFQQAPPPRKSITIFLGSPPATKKRKGVPREQMVSPPGSTVRNSPGAGTLGAPELPPDPPLPPEPLLPPVPPLGSSESSLPQPTTKRKRHEIRARTSERRMGYPSTP